VQATQRVRGIIAAALSLSTRATPRSANRRFLLVKPVASNPAAARRKKDVPVRYVARISCDTPGSLRAILKVPTPLAP